MIVDEDCCVDCGRNVAGDYSDVWRNCDTCGAVLCENKCTCDTAKKLGFCEHDCRCSCEVLPSEVGFAC